MNFFQQSFICKKCGKKIDPENGYWYWEKNYALKDGHYHPECGMINNIAPKGFLPFEVSQ